MEGAGSGRMYHSEDENALAASAGWAGGGVDGVVWRGGGIVHWGRNLPKDISLAIEVIACVIRWVRRMENCICGARDVAAEYKRTLRS
jgi:hypothetical protein